MMNCELHWQKIVKLIVLQVSPIKKFNIKPTQCETQ